MTHDVYIFRLDFPNPEWISGLWVGGHFILHAEVSPGKNLSRKYTPISTVCEKGHATFAIKIYREHEDYPDGGRMSQYLEKLSIGDSIMVEGPVGRFKYKGWGNFEIKKEKVTKITHLLLICAGTGLTPHWNIA